MKKLLLLVGLLFALLGSAMAAVNINTATKDELDGLKGIGPAKAQAIFDYRTKNGPFKSVDDLKNVNGIGPKTLEDLRKDVAVSGASTAAKPGATSASPAKAAEVPKLPAPAAPSKAAEPAKAAVPATPAKAAEPAKDKKSEMKDDAKGKKVDKKDKASDKKEGDKPASK